MELIQNSDQAIDVTDWQRDDDFARYPEGARDKKLLYSSSQPLYSFLKKNHRYLFKLSNPRYPDQFWVEIFAYRLGCQMAIPVPPAFVAYDQTGQCAALIEWYLSPLNLDYTISGGDYCQVAIKEFDRKKGEKHNFESVATFFTNHLPLLLKSFQVETNWENYWAKTFLFDALIGNTDRHQDNWAVIVHNRFIDGTPFVSIETKEVCIAPVFDNGTSMGHEIYANAFQKFDDPQKIEDYVSGGQHHMKWALNDVERIKHSEMLVKFIETYSGARGVMLDCLNRVNSNIFENILNNLVAFDVPLKLSSERAAFMLKLLNYRHQRLLRILEL